MRGREDGLCLCVLLEPLAALGQEEAALGRLGAVLGQQVVGLGHAVGPEVAGGEQVERVVGGQFGVQPLRQEGGVSVRVVVQAVPNGSLWNISI